MTSPTKNKIQSLPLYFKLN